MGQRDLPSEMGNEPKACTHPVHYEEWWGVMQRTDDASATTTTGIVSHCMQLLLHFSWNLSFVSGKELAYKPASNTQALQGKPGFSRISTFVNSVHFCMWLLFGLMLKCPVTYTWTKHDNREQKKTSKENFFSLFQLFLYSF